MPPPLRSTRASGTREAWIVVDLGFGDSGKGATTDFLVRDRGADLVVRFNGGAQAGHTVALADGRHHTFSQFGAGSFVAGVRTLLGPHCVLHPGGMFVEARALADKGVPDVWERTYADERALLISPFQQAAGRLREVLRGPAAHGTCGVGVGEAVSDAITSRHDALRVADLADTDRVAARLRAQQMRKRLELESDAAQAHTEWSVLTDPSVVDRTLEVWSRVSAVLRTVTAEERTTLLRDARGVVCEGAQGVLLDQDHGFHPHTTRSDCTPAGARTLIDGHGFDVRVLGVARAYATRHGAGPFPTHDPRWDTALPEPHNDDRGWQGPFRRGPFDAVLARHAIEVCGGVDGLALTCLDRVHDPAPICVAYDLEATAAALVERDGGGRVVRLRPSPDGASLAHQERLTMLLHRARPALEVVPRRELAATIESELGVPVELISHGPTAAAREWAK